METFNILTLSGGGIKGLFQASFLKLLEKEYHVPLTDIFDLIAGTSTGSIVGAAIAKGIPMDKVENLYIHQGANIFNSKIGKYARSSWYANHNLRKRLTEQFGSDKMSSIKSEILIPTTSLENGKHKVFTNKDGIKIVDALMSSAAAPFYFDAYDIVEDSKHSYVDGGLWANNPTLLAILYAITELDVPISRIRVLSIGTATKSEGMDANIFNKIATFRPQKIMSVINAIFNASEDFSYQYASRILGEKNIVYFCPVNDVSKDIGLTEVKKAVKSLPSLADNVYRSNKDNIIALLGYEGRSRNTIKRSYFIKEEDIFNVGLVDFVPSREEYKNRKPQTLKDYLSKATKSIKIISVSLTDAIEYHGCIKTLETIIKQNPKMKVTISLLNPENGNLLSIMAPILDLTSEDLKTRIQRAAQKIFKNPTLKKTVDFKVHNTIPTGTYIIIDEDCDGASMIIESRPFSSPSSCSFSYHVTKSENSGLFDNIIEGIHTMENAVTQKLSKNDIKKWAK